MDNFDLNLMRVFDAIWRHGHLGMAAADVGLSQSALSHALKRLRAQAGDSLFLKARNGMQPSPRAIQLAPVIQSWLATVRENVLATPAFDPASARRTFTITMSDVGEMAILPRLLARVRRSAPAIDIRVVATPHRDLRQFFERAKIDLALGYFPDLPDRDVREQSLFRHGFLCLARQGHPVVQGTLSLAQFCEQGHVLARAGGRSLEVVDRYLREHNISRREVAQTCNYMSIPAIVASTDLLATVPFPVADFFARMLAIQVLAPPCALPTFELRQFWHASQDSDPGNRWLRALVLDVFGNAADHALVQRNGDQIDQ